MVTVKGWYEGGGEGLGGWGDECSVNGGGVKGLLSELHPFFFLNILTEGVSLEYGPSAY